MHISRQHIHILLCIMWAGVMSNMYAKCTSCEAGKLLPSLLGHAALLYTTHQQVGQQPYELKKVAPL